jgi:hypothetical protein
MGGLDRPWREVAALLRFELELLSLVEGTRALAFLGSMNLEELGNVRCLPTLDSPLPHAVATSLRVHYLVSDRPLDCVGCEVGGLSLARGASFDEELWCIEYLDQRDFDAACLVELAASVDRLVEPNADTAEVLRILLEARADNIDGVFLGRGWTHRA